MITVNMHEAKSRLSELVRAVESGERVVIARAGLPVAELAPYADQGRREGNVWQGDFWIADDFDAPLPGLERAMYEE